MDKELLKQRAEYYRNLYNTGKCDRNTAKENIQPYIDFVNNNIKIISKKYNRKPRYISFITYIR